MDITIKLFVYRKRIAKRSQRFKIFPKKYFVARIKRYILRNFNIRIYSCVQFRCERFDCRHFSSRIIACKYNRICAAFFTVYSKRFSVIAYCIIRFRLCCFYMKNSDYQDYHACICNLNSHHNLNILKIQQIYSLQCALAFDI